MSSRRIILVVLLATLGLSAVMGIFAITSQSDNEMVLILWVAILTAIASGLLLPLTLLTDRANLRLTGYLAMAVVVCSWLAGLGLVFMELTHTWRSEEAVGVFFLYSLLTGVPAVGLSLLQRFSWARIAVPAFLRAAGLGWGIGVLGAIMIGIQNTYHSDYYRLVDAFMITALLIYGMGICVAELLLNYGCGDRRHFRYPGIAAAGLAFMLIMPAAWIPALQGRVPLFEEIAKIGFAFMTVAIVLGHINLVLMARLRAGQRVLQYATIAMTLLGGLSALPLPFLWDHYGLEEFFIRMTVALGIATGCASIGLIVLSMLNRKPPALLAPGALTATDVTLFCPRCQAKQTLPLGNGVCANCELHITVSVLEPRCPACGYLLYRLTSQNCPECGAQIRESSTPPAATISTEVQGELCGNPPGFQTTKG